MAVTEAIAFSGKNRNGAAITLLAARAASYPAAYWKSYLASAAWRQQRIGGRLILSQSSPKNALVQALFEQHGYFVETTGHLLPLAEIVQFCAQLRFQAS